MPLCSVFAIQSRPEPWHMVDNITAGNHGGMTQSLFTKGSRRRCQPVSRLAFPSVSR